MPRTLTLIRALAFDDVAQALAANLASAGAEVVFVCDESRGAVDTGAYAKIALTAEGLGALGLAPLPDNWGWLCGDMCYYAAAEAYPARDHYLLIESDVFFGPQAARALMTALDACPDEILAAQLARHDAPKRYSRGLAQLGYEPRDGCIFPVSRASARAVRLMKALRIRALTECPHEKINDEAILASVALTDGLPHRALESLLPQMFDRANFDTNPPHLFDSQRDAPDPMRAFHPAVSYANVLARVQSGEKNYHKHRLRRVLAEASRDQRVAIKAALQEREGKS